MTDRTCTGEFAAEYAERIESIRDLPPRGPDFFDVLTADQRQRFDRFLEPFGEPNLPEVATQDAEAPGPHGPVPVRVYTPLSDAAGPRPALVWMHGGAFIFGDLDMPEADHVARVLADAADAVVVSVDYRLVTNEIHFPVPHEDCMAAYQWTAEHASELGLDPTRIAVGGGSAGANLAAGIALHLRDEGTPPWQVLLAYPAAHAEFPTPDADLEAALAKLPVVLRLGTTPIEPPYVARPEDATPYAYPALADDLTGYPPTFIDNDEFDSLRASGEEFARLLRDAGVDVELRTTCGVPHGHLNQVGSQVAAASLVRYAERLRGQF